MGSEGHRVITYSDGAISDMIAESKSLPKDWNGELPWRDKRGHVEAQIELEGESGNRFRLILRQGKVDRLDFSVILAVQHPQTNRQFRLLRYDGSARPHRNAIEGNRIATFHIHRATERYQLRRGEPDDFAEATERYDTAESALRCLINDANIEIPSNVRIRLT